MKQLIDLTIKECEDYYHTKCNLDCDEKECPLLVGCCCILDLTGTSNDSHAKKYYEVQGMEFDKNTRIGELLEEIINRKVSL